MAVGLSVLAGHLASVLRRFAANRRGATSIEYAVLASGLAAAIAAIFFTIGDEVVAMFQYVLDRWYSV